MHWCLCRKKHFFGGGWGGGGVFFLPVLRTQRTREEGEGQEGGPGVCTQVQPEGLALVNGAIHHSLLGIGLVCERRLTASPFVPLWCEKVL